MDGWIRTIVIKIPLVRETTEKSLRRPEKMNK